jgi:hypothetical protein
MPLTCPRTPPPPNPHPCHPHRPDIATHLPDDSVRQMFHKDTPAADCAAVLAALLMLPEGWDQLMQGQQQPLAWLREYISRVLQVGRYMWGTHWLGQNFCCWCVGTKGIGMHSYTLCGPDTCLAVPLAVL